MPLAFITDNIADIHFLTPKLLRKITLQGVRSCNYGPYAFMHTCIRCISLDGTSHDYHITTDDNSPGSSTIISDPEPIRDIVQDLPWDGYLGTVESNVDSMSQTAQLIVNFMNERRGGYHLAQSNCQFFSMLFLGCLPFKPEHPLLSVVSILRPTNTSEEVNNLESVFKDPMFLASHETAGGM